MGLLSPGSDTDPIPCVEMTCEHATAEHNYGDPECSYAFDRKPSTDFPGAEEITVRRKTEVPD